jgi:RNA polymerase sigma-70 factor, ECF subfamily
MAIQSVVLDRLVGWVSPADEKDWDALYAEQLPRVYNYFRYRVGPDDAEDLTSETFGKAWRARHRYRRDLAGFSTWLMTIARNVAVDHWRRRHVHLPLEAAADVPSGSGSPEDHALAQSDRERLGELMQGLPEQKRELLALKYGAGMTNRAIARLTGLTDSNVGTILHRTILELRAGWRENSHDG